MSKITPQIAPQGVPDAKTGATALGLLMPFLRPYKWPLTGGIAAMVVASSMMLAIGWGLKGIVDQGFNDGSGQVLNQALLGLFVVIVLMSFASYARFELVNRVAERVIADLRKKIYSHLMTLDGVYLDSLKTGDQVAKINADTTVLQLVITSNLPSAFRHSLMLFGGIIMLLLVSPKMTALALLAVPVVILPAVYFGRRVRAKSRETQTRIGDISAYSHETVQGLQTIQSFGYEATALKSFAQLADETYMAALRYVRVRALLTAFVIAVVFGAIGILLWAGGHKVLNGEMTGGELSAFIFYAAMVAGAVAAVSEAMSDFNRANGAADRIRQLLDSRPSVASHNTARVHFPVNRGDLRFENVSFSYPSRLESKAIDGLTLEIKGGQTVALVGPSGAGKSTLFHLLQRFYDPQQGSILIDGQSIDGFHPSDVRDCMAVVAQDPVVFSLSVAENIRLAKPDASDEDIRRVAMQAQAHDFIMDLPQGYDTLIGERGNRLSGGQRQRLAIARALLKDPRILLLDEATSALDAANEVAVHDALKTLMRGRTTLIIAHRLSTVREADMIVVLDAGKLVASGTHDSLFGSNSLYTHLAGLQIKAA